MTYEQAHTWLENKQTLMTQNRWNFLSIDVEVNAIAIQCVEKQIPKEHHYSAIKEVDGKGVYFRFSICPSCLKEIISYKNDKPPKYCTNCGQALDWSDEE